MGHLIVHQVFRPRQLKAIDEKHVDDGHLKFDRINWINKIILKISKS